MATGGQTHWVDGLPFGLTSDAATEVILGEGAATITTATAVVAVSAATAGVVATITTPTTVTAVGASVSAAAVVAVGETTVLGEGESVSEARLTRETRQTLGDEAADAESRITRETRQTIGDVLADPEVRLTRVTAQALGGVDADPEARITRITRQVIGPPTEVGFTNDRIVGLTWMEVTTRSGDFYVWSDRPLPDPSFYFGGWKEPRVIEWGTIRRASSGWTGEYETSNFDVTLNDTDRVVRQLDLDQELAKASVVVRMISDEQRRLLGTPRIVYRGVITEWGPTGTLEYRLSIKDTFAEKFSTGAPKPDRIPLRRITVDDFPNCAATKVSSATDYVTTPAYGSFTVTLASPGLFTMPNHHLKNQAAVIFETTGALPTGLSPSTQYFVTNPTEQTFNVSATPGGPAIVTSGTQSGIHTLYASYGFGGIGQNTIGVVNGSGRFTQGQVFHFGSHETSYTVESSSGTDPETTLQFTPSLPAPLPDDDPITTLPTFSVQPALNKPVPIVYGLITDRWISESTESTSIHSLPFDPTIPVPDAFSTDVIGGALLGRITFVVTALRGGFEGPPSPACGTNLTTARSVSANWDLLGSGITGYRVYMHNGEGAATFNPNTGARSPDVTQIVFQTHDLTVDGVYPWAAGPRVGLNAHHTIIWDDWPDGTDYEEVIGERAADQGDGQGSVTYVGDRELPDGYTYAEFLWASHACHAPTGRPLQMLYFWNESVDDLAAGSATGQIVQDGTPIVFGDLATEAGSGGRICLPGYDNWDDQGFTFPFRDYNGRRYTVFFLRGIFRDWALGIAGPPANLGGVPLAVNGYGCDLNADGSGGLITNGLRQYLHFIQNWCSPVGDGYQSGSWLNSPTFRDDPSMSMLDEGSFFEADTQSKIYVPDGFRGDFIIGANGEFITRREAIARFNFSFGVDSAFNRRCQFMVNLINVDQDSITFKTTLDFVRAMFQGTFDIESRMRELFNAIDYRHTQDYLSRADGGWRSVALSPITLVTDTVSEGIYDQSAAPQALFYLIRGNPSTGPIEEYYRGLKTVAVVLALKLLRNSVVPHFVAFQTGPFGMMYEIFDYTKLTHFEGLSSSGWVDHPARVDRMEVSPTTFTTWIELFDMRRAFDEPFAEFAEQLAPSPWLSGGWIIGDEE